MSKTEQVRTRSQAIEIVTEFLESILLTNSQRRKCFKCFIEVYSKGPWGLRVAEFGYSNGSCGTSWMRSDRQAVFVILEDLIIEYMFWDDDAEIMRYESELRAWANDTE